MTTIAVNATIGTMAGDKQFTYGTTKLVGKTKIYELSEAGCANFGCEKAFVGFSGNANGIGDAIHWLMNPDDNPPKVKGIEMVMLNNKKQILHANRLDTWMLLDQKIFAMGSGGAIAWGALAAGKTPLEAVKIAAKYDTHTGMGFNSLTL